MAQVCLGQKHFLFGQGWVDGCSPHPMTSSKRFLYMFLLWPRSVWTQLPPVHISSALFSLQMEARVCAKFPHPKEPSRGTWPEESILFDWQHRACLPLSSDPEPHIWGQTGAWRGAEPGLWLAWRAGGQKKLLSMLGVMV